MVGLKVAEQRTWPILPGRLYVYAGKTIDAGVPAGWLEQVSEPLA